MPAPAPRFLIAAALGLCAPTALYAADPASAAPAAAPAAAALAGRDPASPGTDPAPPGTDPAPPEINQAQRLVFMNDGMRNVPAGSVLEYAFTRQGKDKDSFRDRVTVAVSRVAEDGGRDLQFDFLSGGRHLDFHPASDYRGNPVSIHFLERDIYELSKDTGGDAGYFRNRIRRAFAHPQIRPVKIAVDGQQLDAVSVTLVPFADDPNRARFPDYAGKRYDFVFSEGIPGGLYRIRTQVPAASGGAPALEEELTFQRATPAG